QLAALFVEREQLVDALGRTPAGERRLHALGIAADQLEVERRGPPGFLARAAALLLGAGLPRSRAARRTRLAGHAGVRWSDVVVRVRRGRALGLGARVLRHE